MMLKTDSLTRSVVGRVFMPGTGVSLRPRAVPEITRMVFLLLESLLSAQS